MKLIVTPGAAQPLVLGDDLEAGLGEQLLGERLRGLAFLRRARLEVCRRRSTSSATVRLDGSASARCGLPSSRTRKPRDVDVGRVEVVADVTAVAPRRGDERGARAHERIEHEIVLVGVEVDQAPGQLDRERRRDATTRRALSGSMSHTSSVAAMNSSASIVFSDGRPRALAIGAAQRAVEAALARDDDALGGVAQHRVRRRCGTIPTRSCRPRLRPCARRPRRAAAAELVLEDVDDVGREAAVRLAAEVRDVHRDAPARLELARALGEHVGEHLEVLDVRARARRRARAPPRTACPRSTAVT